jgi:hypothetical protein
MSILEQLQHEWEQCFNLAYEGETWLSFKRRRILEIAVLESQHGPTLEEVKRLEGK